MKACKQCKALVKNSNKCPVCGSEDLTEKWYGLVVILNPEKSELAKLLNINVAGEYALQLE